MFSKLNLQHFLSYMGLIPFIIIIFNKYLPFQIDHNIISDFIIFYTLIIVVFIGSINWNLEKKIENIKIIYGFIPSFFSSILILLNLFDFNFYLLFSLLILF